MFAKTVINQSMIILPLDIKTVPMYTHKHTYIKRINIQIKRIESFLFAQLLPLSVSVLSFNLNFKLSINHFI